MRFICCSLAYSLLHQAVFETRLKDMAMAVPLMCCAADMLTVPSRKQVVLVGHKHSVEFENMLAAAHASYDINKTVSLGFLCLNSQVHLFILLYPSLLRFPKIILLS